MAEINNSLALGVKPMEFDIMKPLAGAAQINSLRASTEKTQQDVDYNNRLQSQGVDGMRPQEQNTLAVAHKNEMDIAGSIGNVMVNDPSAAGVKQAIKMAKDAGKKIDPETEQHLLSSPPQQIVQYGKNLQAGGMQPSNTNVLAQTSQAQTGGAKVGGIYGPPGFQPPQQPTAAPIIGEKSVAGGPPKNTLLDTEEETKLNAAANAKVYNDTQQQAASAPKNKAVLDQILLDAKRVRTGSGSEQEQAVRKWAIAAGDTFPALKGITDQLKDKTKAFESLDKNAGWVAREAQKSVGGTAASELQFISSTLASHNTTNGGIELNVSQLRGLENANIGKLNAADLYKQKYQTMSGFTSWYNKNAGAAAWIIDALPTEEKQLIVSEAKKSPKGQEMLKSLTKQVDFIRKNNLHEGTE